MPENFSATRLSRAKMMVIKFIVLKESLERLLFTLKIDVDISWFMFRIQKDIHVIWNFERQQ